MDFRLGPKSDALRAEVRTFIREHYSAEAREQHHHSGDGHNWELHRKLAERGWISASWPVEVGGQGRDAYEMMAFEEELCWADFPYYGLANNSLIGQALLATGSEEQKREIVGGIARGEVLLAMGYSEPGSGSDVAAAQTRAVRDGGDWIINGSKIFTSLAHMAQYIFALVRTDPDLPKRKGLTMFLVPTDAPGVEIQPLYTIGHRTNVVFFEDVRVDDALRVGEVNDGWSVLRAALDLEHGAGFHDVLQSLHEQVASWARSRERMDDPDARERLARAAMVTEVSKLLAYRAAWLFAEGRPDRGEGPMAKLFSSEAYVETAADLTNLLGPEALLTRGEQSAPAAGEIEYHQRNAQVTTIYAGTSEIQRSLIAEGKLGLPRSRR